MNYRAMFQENESLPHVIAVTRTWEEAKAAECAFVSKMQNPKVVPWWVWIEETEELTEQQKAARRDKENGR